MNTVAAHLDEKTIADLRARRAELRESMGALELALAAPLADPGHWLERVHAALVELDGDLCAHVEITEGPEGLHRDVTDIAPRLAEPARQLADEHGVARRLVDDLLAAAEPDHAHLERVRTQANELLAMLVRHRQRGADLVYEAYQVDVGGET